MSIIDRIVRTLELVTLFMQRCGMSKSLWDWQLRLSQLVSKLRAGEYDCYPEFEAMREADPPNFGHVMAAQEPEVTPDEIEKWERKFHHLQKETWDSQEGFYSSGEPGHHPPPLM